MPHELDGAPALNTSWSAALAELLLRWLCADSKITPGYRKLLILNCWPGSRCQIFVNMTRAEAKLAIACMRLLGIGVYRMGG